MHWHRLRSYRCLKLTDSIFISYLRSGTTQHASVCVCVPLRRQDWLPATRPRLGCLYTTDACFGCLLLRSLPHCPPPLCSDSL